MKIEVKRESSYKVIQWGRTLSDTCVTSTAGIIIVDGQELTFRPPTSNTQADEQNKLISRLGTASKLLER